MATLTMIDTVTYSINKCGRKWLHASRVPGGFPARIEINEQSAGFCVGEQYTFLGRVHRVQINLDRHTDNGMLISRTDVIPLPADYKPNRRDRQATCRFWLDVLQKAAFKGYLNQGAVNAILRAGVRDFPALQAEFESLFSFACCFQALTRTKQAIDDYDKAKTEAEREKAAADFDRSITSVKARNVPLAETLQKQFDATRAEVVNRQWRFVQPSLFG